MQETRDVSFKKKKNIFKINFPIETKWIYFAYWRTHLFYPKLQIYRKISNICSLYRLF